MHYTGCGTRQPYLLRGSPLLQLMTGRKKRQGIRNGDLGHKNGRTWPSRRETNNEMWDLSFSRRWTCKRAVVSNMTTCSFLRPLRVFSGKQMLPSSGRTKEPASFSESLLITYLTTQSGIMNTLRIGLPGVWFWTEHNGTGAKKIIKYRTYKCRLCIYFSNGEHNDLYSPNIIRVMKSGRMRWAGHVERMGNRRGAHRV